MEGRGAAGEKLFPLAEAGSAGDPLRRAATAEATAIAQPIDCRKEPPEAPGAAGQG